MRRFLVILVAVLLLLAVLFVAFGAWALHDEDFLKGQTARIVEKYTGRSLSIDGSFSLELGRKTSLSASNVSFANAPWAQEPAMVSAGSLFVSIDIPALFDHAVMLPELRLGDCSVNLQKSDSGQANWQFAVSGEEQPAESESESDWTFRMDGLDIDRCELKVDGPQREKPLLVEIDKARLDRGEKMRVTGEIDGRLDREKLSVKGWTDPLRAFSEGGPLAMELDVASGDVKLELSGSFADAAQLSGPDLAGRLRGPEIGVILDHFALPPVSEGDFDFRVRLATRDGRATIDVDGDLGSLEARAEGDLDRLADPTSGQASATVHGPDLKALGQALGVDAPLGKAFELDARLAFAPGTIHFEQASLQTDDERAEVNGSLSTAAQLAGTALHLALHSRDISRWLKFAGLEQSPPGALSLESKVNVDASGELQIDGKVEHAGAALEAKGALGPLSKPVVPDLDLAFSSGDLSSLGPTLGTDSLPAAPVDLSGHVKRDGHELALSGVKLKLAENSATIDGSLELDRLFEGFDLRAALDITDLAEFGKLFDRPDLPEGPVRISGTLARDGKELRFTVDDGDLGDIVVDLDGHIADLDQPTRVDANFELHLPSARTVATWLPGLLLPEGPVSATGRLQNQPDRTRIDNVRFRVARTEATVDGHIGHDRSFELKIGFSGPDLTELQELAGISFPALPFDLSTGVSGNLQDMAFRDLHVRMGESEAQGDLRYEHGAVRRVTGTIAGRHVDLTHWIRAEQAADKREAEQAASRYVFDDTPVLQWSDLGWEANVRASAEELAIANGRYTDLDIGFLLEGSRAKVSPFKITANGGGQFQGELRIDGDDGVPTLDFELEAKNYPLQLMAAEGQDPSTLPVAEFQLDLRGHGQTHREMATSLEGKVRLSIGPGEMAPSSIGFLLSDFLTEFFKALMPWREPYERTYLECAVAAADVQGGLLKLAPMVFNMRQVTIISQGTIDLETERIDLAFNSKQRKGLGISASDLVNPFFKIGGTLAAPALELDPAGTVVKGGLAVATMGISILANSLAERYLSSKDPCGDAQKAIDKRDAKSP